MSRFDPQLGKLPPYGVEVGRFMTETSLYFIEANIFRGLSQLSRKTQLCVRAAWTGQSLVFWVLCFL